MFSKQNYLFHFSRQVVKDFNFSEDHSKMLLDFPLNKLASLENGTLLSTTTPTNEGLASADTTDRIDDAGELSSHQSNQQTADSNGAKAASVGAAIAVGDKDGASDEGGEGGDENVHCDGSHDGETDGAEGKQAKDGKAGRKRQTPTTTNVSISLGNNKLL